MRRRKGIKTRKILFFIRTLSEGGSERVTSVLASALAEQFNENVYVCTLDERKEEYTLSSKISVEKLKKHSENKWKQIVYEISFIERCIKEVNPDIIISLDSYRTNLFILLCSFGKQKSLLFSERNDPNRIPKKRIGRLLRTISYKVCDGVVFQTYDARDYFCESIRKKSVVIPNPVLISNIDVFTDKWSKRRKAIVNCSRIVPQKNIRLLIEAFADIAEQFPEYVLEIYGQGEQFEELKELTKFLNLDNRVIFWGFKKNAIQMIKDAALYVSTSDFEGISNSMLEAMALGLPVICTDCPIGGARMAIDNGKSGLLVPVKNKRAVAEAMVRVLSDEKYAQSLGNKATRVVEKFSVSSIAQQWVDYINILLNSNKQ